MSTATKIAPADLRKARNQRIADALGDKRAQIKLLQDEAKALENELIQESLESGELAFNGWRFRVAISRSERKTTAWQKIARDLGASARKIAANTKASPITRVVVSALNKSAG